MIEAEEAPITFPGAGCPECGSSVMAARNPFYGIGLAVHQYVRNCVECAWYNFAADSSFGKTAAEPTPKPGFAILGLWTRLSAAVSVVKAA